MVHGQGRHDREPVDAHALEEGDGPQLVHAHLKEGRQAEGAQAAAGGGGAAAAGRAQERTIVGMQCMGLILRNSGAFCAPSMRLSITNSQSIPASAHKPRIG